MVWKTLGLAALVGVVLAMCGNASAATWASNQPVILKSQGSQVVASPGAALTGAQMLSDLLSGRTYTPKGNGDVDLRDLLKDPYVPKVNTPVAAVRAVPWASVAKGVGRAVPFVGTALTIKDLLDSVRCREKFGGGPECDDGQPEGTVTRYTIPAGEYGCNNGQPNGSVPAVSAPTAQGAAVLHLQGLASACNWQQPSAVFPQGGLFCVNALQPWGQQTQGCAPAPTGPNQIQQCPQITVNAQPFFPPVGIDGKCPTTIYTPKSEEQVAEKVQQWANKGAAGAAAAELDIAGIPMEHPAPQFQVPPLVIGERSTTSKPDGSTTVRDTDYPMEATPDGYKWRERITETDYPPGSEIPPQGTTPPLPGTVTEGTPANVELKTCGLPGTPPCKIDETGTPPGTGIEQPGIAGLEAIKEGAIERMTSDQQTALPWLWALELPSGACSVFTWTVKGHTIIFDFCNNSLVLFWRALWAWALAIFTALYIWRSVGANTGT